MITVNSNGQPLSEGFIEALTEENRSYDAILFMDGEELECSITSLSVDKGSCGSEYGFSIGNVYGSTLVANVTELSAEVKGKDIEVRIGVEVNGAYEYVTMGVFRVSSTAQNLYATTITAYGASITATGGVFEAPQTNTLADVASAIASAVSENAGRPITVTFGAGITTTDEMPAVTGTVYQALQALATVVGGFACDTHDGNIKVCRFSNTPTLVRDAETMRYLPVVDEQDFIVNGVAWGGGDGNLSVESKYITQALYDEYLATLVGYNYRPATVGLAYGDPRLEGEDVLRVLGVPNRTAQILLSTQGTLRSTDGILRVQTMVCVVPCHMITHVYDGGFSTQVVSVSATEIENDITSSAGGLTEKLNSIEETANETSAYFWYVNGTGAEAGAHITQVPQQTFEEDPSGNNVHIDADSVDLRNGTEVMATFGIDGAQIGADETQRLELSRNGLKGYNEDDIAVLDVSYDVGGTYIEEYISYMLPISTAKSFSDDQPHTISSRQEPLELESWATSFRMPDMSFRMDRYNTGVVWTNVTTDANTTASIDDDGVTVRIYDHNSITLTVGTSETYTSSAIVYSAVDSIKITFEFTYDAQAETTSLAVIGQRLTTDGSTLKVNNYRGSYGLALPIQVTTAPALTFGEHSGAGLGEYSVRMGKRLNATGDTQTVIGRDNDNQTDTAFEIGNGDIGARSNAFTVDWDGNVEASGAIRGVTEKPTVTITTSVGELVGAYVRRFGNVVQINLSVKNSSSVAVGSPIYEGTLEDLKPSIFISGATYYGSHMVAGGIGSTGQIIIRNTSTSAFSPSQTALGISFTYIV